MIDPVRQVLQPLVQRSAQGDVQFLKPPADRQQRNTPSDGCSDEGEGDAVAGGVFGCTLGMRGAIV
jgi:hypothetical protein